MDKRMLLLLTLTVTLSGCGVGDWAKDKVEWAKEKTGLTPSPEELQAQAEERAAKLKTADDLVERWADKFEKTSKGFRRHEGLTEIDPWGEFIQISYEQDWQVETMTIRSAGPDAVFNTPDDLIRHRKTDNWSNIAAGAHGWPLVVVLWMFSAFFAFLFSLGFQQRRKESKHESKPVLTTMFIVVLAPLALLVYVCMSFVIALGTVLGMDTSNLDIDLAGLDLDIF